MFMWFTSSSHWLGRAIFLFLLLVVLAALVGVALVLPRADSSPSLAAAESSHPPIIVQVREQALARQWRVVRHEATHILLARASTDGTAEEHGAVEEWQFERMLAAGEIALPAADDLP